MFLFKIYDEYYNYMFSFYADKHKYLRKHRLHLFYFKGRLYMSIYDIIHVIKIKSF